MDINGSVNVHSRALSGSKSELDNSYTQQQATRIQKETQSVDEVLTEKPVQEVSAANQDIVNERISEHQLQASNNTFSLDESIGSLIDITV